MSMCERAGLGVIDDGTLPKTREFKALCACGRVVTVTSGQIEWHEKPKPGTITAHWAQEHVDHHDDQSSEPEAGE